MPRSTSTDGRLPAVVLAAGESRRFTDSNKLLINIEGRPLLLLPVEACCHAYHVDAVFVVLGHDVERVHHALNRYVDDPPVTVLINEHWNEGLSTSLQTAIEALPEDTPGVLIVPGDMPFMTSELIDRVAETMLRTDRICFPTLDDRKGHPTAIPRRYFQQLLEVEGDTGAREIVRDHWAEAVILPLNPGEFSTQTDVDTVAHYRDLPSDRTS